MLVIPKVQARAGKAFADCHPIAVGKFDVIFQDLWQAVERYPAVEVMHVVDADVRA